MKHIVTLTMNPCIDVGTRIDNVVAEQKLRCGEPSFEPGGGGINVSRAIHKLGGRSVAVYTAGGALGELLQDLLDREAVRHRPVKIREQTRESFMVRENSTGQQYRFSLPGPHLETDEWKACLAAVCDAETGPEYLVLSGSLPPGVPEDFYAEIAKQAGEAGTKVILDATGAPFRSALQEGVFLIKPNLRELRLLSDIGLDSEGQQEAFAEKLVKEGRAQVVVVSLGAAGALMVWNEGSRRFRAPTVNIQSKVGAGDSMVAGIVLGLARDESFEEAVRFGVASGAAAVMTPGTKLCREEDTVLLYRRMKSKM
jgi:6-phosphofructokinase 2